MSDICAICYEPLKEDIFTTKCNHKFHYDCMFMVLRNNTKTNIRKRECPYCRNDTGYLPLKPGCIPQKYIHKEYIEMRNLINNGNFELVKKFLNKDKCMSILKTGKNKGLQCSHKKIENSDYCKKHMIKADDN